MKNGIDFSSSIFGELVGESNCGAGKVFGVTCKLNYHCESEDKRDSGKQEQLYVVSAQRFFQTAEK